MRPRESYTRFVAVAFVFTLAVLATFQLYIFNEPARIAADEVKDNLIAVSAGRTLFAENCALCHGEQGEGVDGPPLNDKNFLKTTSDETIFSLIGSGIPGTEMPAWNQAHGGPFTDQEVRQLVAFVRNWEEGAPDRAAEALRGDPVQGLVIFSSTCVVCHGESGLGTDRAPALNDPVKLAQFDDAWYEDTIAEGRPAKGMPTWGTVLAPERIRDLVALLRAWQGGQIVNLPGPEEYLHEAAHMLGHGEIEEALHQLEQAASSATGEQLDAINEAIAALETGDVNAATEAIERAESHGGGGEVMPGMDMGDSAPPQPGEAEARAALDELKMGMADAATAKLNVALVLAQGDLKEAIEHALEDLEAGKPDEAQAILEQALGVQP